MNTREMVRVLDPETGNITSMPAAELAPGMIRAQIQGEPGEVWIVAGSASTSAPLRHPPFDEEDRQIMRYFRDLFADVYPLTADEWEDGFRRDMSRDREIAYWLCIAQTFEHFTGRPLRVDQRRDIFSVILAYMNAGGSKYVRQTTSPRTLSTRRVREITDYMDEQSRSGWKWTRRQRGVDE